MDRAKDMEGPLISIIVPVYNVEKYLPTCVDSILAQSYERFELILVDDGSPDKSPQICDAYAATDERVRVIHQENGGLSAARNAGLDAARGELIGFVDSDDSISPTMYESLLRAMTAADADISLCNYLLVDEAGARSSDGPGLRDEVVTGRESILRRLEGEGSWYWVIAWNKLYRRALFDGLRYPLKKLHEDEFLIHHLLLRCEKAASIAEAHYDYRQHPASITGGGFSLRRLDGAEAQFSRAEALLCHGLPAASAYYACAAGLLVMQKGFAALDLKSPGYQKRYQELTRQFRGVAGKLIVLRLPLMLKARLALNCLSPYLAWRGVERFLRRAEGVRARLGAQRG